VSEIVREYAHVITRSLKRSPYFLKENRDIMLTGRSVDTYISVRLLTPETHISTHENALN